MSSKLEELKRRLIEINDLQSASALLSWDQETYMPPKGAPARARQMATLQRLAHEAFTHPDMGELIESCRLESRQWEPDSDDAALIRKTHRDYERIKRIPADRYAAFVQHAAMSYPVWVQARKENDFEMVRPNLETTLAFSRELAGYAEEYDHIADPLIDFSDPGMKAEDIRRVFAELREQLVPLVAEIRARPQVDASVLHRHYPEEMQKRLGLEVAHAFGFDPQRCRQDKTHHPFMTKFSHGDIRITTRYREDDFSDGFFSTLHETGHALYEMGIRPEFDATPLSEGVSAGVHESQSRLWENFVGRSRSFWEHYFPLAQSHFPEALGETTVDAFYRAVNRVQPSLIRTEADEVTYNLHIMMRFDLELEMLEGKLAVKDLPEAWRARYESDLGVVPATDADGVLQDVHWFAGLIGGAFQGYALGNIMAAQIWETATREHPEIGEEIARGTFDTLREWLRTRLYQHGSMYLPDDLLKRVTGSTLDVAPLMRYLRNKYSEIYGLAEG